MTKLRELKKPVDEYEVNRRKEIDLYVKHMDKDLMLENKESLLQEIDFVTVREFYAMIEKWEDYGKRIFLDQSLQDDDDYNFSYQLIDEKIDKWITDMEKKPYETNFTVRKTKWGFTLKRDQSIGDQMRSKSKEDTKYKINGFRFELMFFSASCSGEGLYSPFTYWHQF